MRSPEQDGPLISVIIPVYNTGAWLPRCLDSVCGQTLRNIEIICVNDGSSDGSGAILEDYAAKDARILTVTLSRNQGPGVARNIGLAAAHGEWLSFVDSDDSLALDFYDKLYTASKESDAEIVKGICWEEANFPNCINLDANTQIKKDKFKFTNNWVTAIYNRNFITSHNIRLPQISNSEDLVFLYHAVTHANKVFVINDAVYNYFRRAGSSSTSTRTKKRIDNILYARNAMRDILNTNFSLDTNKYISEYTRMIYYLYIFLNDPIQMEDKSYALKAISNAILDSFAKCREPGRLLEEIDKYDRDFSSLIANSDVEGLEKFLSVSRLQRLRNRARAHLAKQA